MVSKETALPGRAEPLFKVANIHTVLKSSMFPPFPSHTKSVMVGLGCFWGAEKLFWKQQGVHSTQVGYAGGFTKNPTYEECCTGNTGHTEVVRVVYEPEKTSLSKLLQVFYENHDPTTVNKQGKDIGTNYRSAVYVSDPAEIKEVEKLKSQFQDLLTKKGFGSIVTEIRSDVEFFYAEDYHQQYLDKNPDGYCGIKGTGVTYQ